RLEHPSVPDHGAPRCMDGSFRKRVAIKIVSASFLSTQSQGFALHRRESKDVSSKRQPGDGKACVGNWRNLMPLYTSHSGVRRRK
ncbi:MAG: hypothetical protein M3Y27_04215, partial [Acidobacteriota bacterium]|nr:hypothetical protein [Acidobacteriota bacterium]